MEALLEWELSIILWLQQFSPTWDPFFQTVINLGEEEFFHYLLPLLIWVFDHCNGMRLFFLLLVALYTALQAQTVTEHSPPFHWDERVQKLAELDGTRFPSVYTVTTVSFWGYLCSQFGRRWLWFAAAIPLLLVPIAALYLGHHFPTEILGGYLVGALLLMLYLRWEPRVERWLASKTLLWQIALALLLPLLLVLFSSKNHPAVGSLGAMLGLGVGLSLERRLIGLTCGGPWWQKLLRLVVDLASLLLLREGLLALFAGLEPAWVFRFVRYALAALWIGLGAPWVFIKLRLAEGIRHEPETVAHVASLIEESG